MTDSKEFKNKFLEFLREGAASKESLDDDLRELGFDPEKLGRTGLELANRLAAEQLVRDRQEAKLRRLAAQAKLASSKPSRSYASEADANEALRQICAGAKGQAARDFVYGHFKNYEGASFEEKVSLLNDIEFLMNQHEEDEPK